jgi:C-terminal processing protease CtpA/Prc
MSTPSHKRLTSADASADHETESADQIQSADASADHETESAPPASAADIDSDSADRDSNAAILTLPMEERAAPGAASVASTSPLSEAERQKPRRTFTFGPGSLGMTFTEAAGRCTFITEVAAGSQAAKKGVVAGSKLVSVAGHPMEGLGSDAAVARIKEEMQRAAQQPMTMELESSAYDAPFQSVETTPSGSNKKASLVARAFGFGSGTKSGSKR